MTLFDIYTYGLIGSAVLMAFNKRSTESPAFIARTLLVWPLTVSVIALVLFLDLFKIDMDVVKTAKAFGARFSTNPKVKGVAVTILFREFQFYRVL